MLPKNFQELEQVRKECKNLVKKRTLMSMVMQSLQIEAGIHPPKFMHLIARINELFGLSYDRLEELDAAVKARIQQLILNEKNELAGIPITRYLEDQLMTTEKVIEGMPPLFFFTSENVREYGDKHVESCYNIVKAYLEGNMLEA